MSKVDTPEAFNISIALSPAVSVILATQFTREGLVRTLTTYTEKPEPMFVVGQNEPEIAVNFLAGLKRDRLELSGLGQSAVILDILGMIATFSDGLAVDTLMSDVGNFANQELKDRWYSLHDRDPRKIGTELSELANFAREVFDRACRQTGPSSQS